MRILFVCYGNICRSPMAEAILRDMAQKRGIPLTVASAATSDEEIIGGVGNPVYPPARAELEKHGLSLPGKRAVQLTRADAAKWDLFIGMDSGNIRSMHRILGPAAAGKIHRLLEFAGRDADVADPWYSRRFDVAWDDIHAGCAGLMERIEKGSLT